MNNIEIFEKYAAEYDQWFDENEAVYKSEILACETSSPPLEWDWRLVWEREDLLLPWASAWEWSPPERWPRGRARGA